MKGAQLGWGPMIRILAALGAVALLAPAGAAHAEAAKRPWRPEVIRRPTGDQVSKVLKGLGIKEGTPIGWALLRCHVDASGKLAPCHVILEAPEQGVSGSVALSVSEFMRIKPATENGKAVDGGDIFVPFQLGGYSSSGPYKSSYVAGNPSFAVLPAGDTRPGAIKIPCPTAADQAATCPARPIHWSDIPPLEESAPILLEAQQAAGFSAVSCQLGAEGGLADCQIKGEDGPRVTETIHKVLASLKSPQWSDGAGSVAATRVTIVFNWTMLSKASATIVAAVAETKPASH